MGVLKKLKDIFYDEEIIDEEVEVEKPLIKDISNNSKPQKKEEEEKTNVKEEIQIPRFEVKEIKPQKEEIEQPTPKSKEDDTIAERELFQSKKTFNFPILDDDEITPPRRSKNVMEIERKEKQERKIQQNEQVTHTFKPTPVISPIYGILDKNFKKEDIINRNNHIENKTNNTSSVAYDAVRKKAYGNLGIENTSKIEASKILNEVDNLEKELSNIDESLSRKKLDSVISDIEENKKITIGEMEERTKKIKIEPEKDSKEIKIEQTSRIEKYKKESEPKQKKISDVGDKTLENDLFNLIDSMYEEEE